MKRKIFLFANPEFDKKYLNGISRLYQIFCKEYDFNLEIIDEDFLKNNHPDKNKKELLVITGGDGTLHKAVNTIPEEYFSAYTFGIIPAGTANEFAKSLSLPCFLEEAALLIANEAKGHKIFHKIGTVNEKYKFLTGLLYGIACHVLQSTSQGAKTFWGPFAYNIPGFMSLNSFFDHIKKFKLNSREFQTGYLIINNAALISKELSFRDIQDENRDLFSIIYVYPEVTTSDLIRLLLKNQAHLDILNDPAIFYTQIKEINLEFEEKSLFMLDGELYEFSSPLKIKHHENCIEIICG